MLKNINVPALEAPALTLDKFRHHRVAYFALQVLTNNRDFRQRAEMRPALEVLDALDPNTSSWGEPLMVGDEGQVAVTIEAISELARKDDGSWLSDEADALLVDRGMHVRTQEIQVPEQRAGTVAVQGVLF